MKYRNYPESWFCPHVVLSRAGGIKLDVLDRSIYRHYRNGQGMLIPALASDGKKLSEQDQFELLKHIVLERVKKGTENICEVLITVLKASPEETSEQIIRWCSILRHCAGEKDTEKALERTKVAGFAVCSPVGETDPSARRAAYEKALELGLPTAVYETPMLIETTVDKDIVIDLIERYEELVLIIDRNGRAADPLAYIKRVIEDERQARAEELEAKEYRALVKAAPLEEFVEAEVNCDVIPACEEPPAEEPREESGEPAACGEPPAEEKSEESGEPAVCEEPPAEEPGEESGEPTVCIEEEDTAVEAAPIEEDNEEETACIEETAPAVEDVPVDAKRPRSRKLPVIIAVGILLAALLGYLLFSMVIMREANERSEELAVEQASVFLDRTVPFVNESTDSVEAAAESVIVATRLDALRETAAKLEYVAAEDDSDIQNTETYKLVQGAYSYDGPQISRSAGAVTGPNGRETFYNLNMQGVVNVMRGRGNNDPYWERDDGCKMLGNYIMVAANLNVHPRGSIVKSSRGLAIVCDTGGFASRNPQQLDIATNW